MKPTNKYTRIIRVCSMLAAGALLANSAIADKPYNLYWLSTSEHIYQDMFSFNVESNTADDLSYTESGYWVYRGYYDASFYTYGPFNLVVDPYYSRLVYMVTHGADKKGAVDVYNINSSGGLSWVNYTAMTEPMYIKITPDSKFAYVVDRAGDSDYDYLQSFGIDASNGSLSKLNSLKVSNAIQAAGMDIIGGLIFLGNSGTVSSYKIDTSNGDVTQKSDGVSLQGAAKSIATDPAANFIYVTTSGPGTVQTYLVTDREKGALVAKSNFSLGSYNGVSSVISPDGSMLYVTTTKPEILSFSIDRATGSLTQIDQDSLKGVPAYDNNAIALDVKAGFVYVGLPNPVNYITIFKIDESSRKLSYTSENVDLTDYDVGYPEDFQTFATPARTSVYNVQPSISSNVSHVSVSNESSQEVSFYIQSNTGNDLINLEKIFNITNSNIHANIVDDSCDSKISKGSHCTIKIQISTSSSSTVTGTVTMHLSGNYEYYDIDGINTHTTNEIYNYPANVISVN